jgi:hypothetical protein
MKRSWTIGIAVMIAAALVFAGCSGKGGGSSSAKSGGKANPASDFGYDLTADGQGIVIKKYTGGPGKVVIPATIEDMPVIEIADKAFSVGSKENEKAGITSITIPNSVKKIGRKAFANTAITTITIPDSVTELVTGRYFGSGLFEGCKLLTEIHFSDNLEVIPGWLGGMYGMPALKKINLPKNLKYIDDLAFANCGELAEIIIPQELTSVLFTEIKQIPGLKSAKEGVDYIEVISVDEGIGWGYCRVSEPDNSAFNGDSKLSIKTRQTIQGWGYTSGF